MRRLLTAGGIALLLVVHPVAQAPGPHPVSIPDLLSIRQVGSPEISPDGQMIVYTVRGWENGTGRDSQRKEPRSHIWRVAADGSRARQLAFSDRGESSPKWSPDGRWISFLSARDVPHDAPRDAAESEGPVTQIWVMPSDGGEAAKLTDSKESVTSYAWSPDAAKIAYVARDPLPKDVDEKRKRRDDAQVFEGDFRPAHLFVTDVSAAVNTPGSSAPEPTELVHDSSMTLRGDPAWSADNTRLAFSALPTPMLRDDRSDIYIVRVDTKAIEKISGNPGADTDPVWSPDGRTIAYLALPNEAKALPDGTLPSRVGVSHLTLYDVATKKTTDAANREFDLSPGPLHWAADSRSLIFSVGVKTYRDIFTLEPATGKYTALTRGQVSAVGSVAKDRVALVMESSAEPPEIYLADRDSRTPRRLTDTNPHARSFLLGKTEVVSWKSDKETIEGVLLKPVNYQEGKRYPLLVVAHGGPSGAYLDNYRVGYGDGGENWAGEGWAVLYPNPRGSSNYGERFERANFKDWGGGDYRDIMAGVDFLIARGVADPDRLAFMGWSYGGYMTCWVVSQTTRFKAAMMGAGLTDMPSMYGTNDIPNVLVTYFGGIPSKDTMPLYTDRSGITYVDRVTTPLLILHGGNDQRVPIGQPMEFYRALKDRGKTVELVFYPREGHGFQEYFHQLDRMQRQHDWIVRYTLGGAPRKTTNQ
jgi:dipeptidyl aminopeptidase/acylaminoacyl peptidase